MGSSGQLVEGELAETKSSEGGDPVAEPGWGEWGLAANFWHLIMCC